MKNEPIRVYMVTRCMKAQSERDGVVWGSHGERTNRSRGARRSELAIPPTTLSRCVAKAPSTVADRARDDRHTDDEMPIRIACGGRRIAPSAGGGTLARAKTMSPPGQEEISRRTSRAKSQRSHSAAPPSPAGSTTRRSDIKPGRSSPPTAPLAKPLMLRGEANCRRGRHEHLRQQEGAEIQIPNLGAALVQR